MTQIGIPDEVLERAVAMAIQQRTDTMNLDDVTVFDAHEAAARLKITPQAFRKLSCDYIDFGSRQRRWTIKDIKALIEKRRVKARR